jgi:hypothetical protein
VVLGLLCWPAGRRIPITRSQFAHPRPTHGDDFEASHGEIEFDVSYLSLPIVQEQTSLKLFLRTSPQWLIVRFINRQGLGSQVFNHLCKCRNEHWPTLATMASERGLSIASFRRQLQREGFSFQELKDEVRRSITFEC